MIELAPFPSSGGPCVCGVKWEYRGRRRWRRGMSERKHAECSHGYRDRDKRHHEQPRGSGRSSADDPSISSSRSEKHVSSNARSHPRAELRGGEGGHSRADQRSGEGCHSKAKHASNHTPNHVLGERTAEIGVKRRRIVEEKEEEEVWTEHVSSSNRVYYYNKKLDKSQWEAPKGFVKQAKPTSSSSSTLSTAHVPPTSSKPTSSSKPASSQRLSSRTDKPHGAVPSSSSKSSPSGSASISSRSSGRHSNSGGVASTNKDRERVRERDSLSSTHRGHYSHTHVERERERDRKRERERETCSSRSAVRDRERHYHRGSRRASPRSRSHSDSTSPGAASSFSKSSWHSQDKTPSRHSRSAPSHAASNSTSTTQTAALPTSPLTPHQVRTSSTGSAVISPVTAVTPSPLLPSLTHQISTTQQIIEHTSAILEHQQRIIAGSAVGDATPTQTTVVLGQGQLSLAQHPHARQKLMFVQNSGSSGHNSAGSTPHTPAQGAGPHQPSSTVTSPLFQGGGGGGASLANMESLHPLQKALLLQQQQQQQQQQVFAQMESPLPPTLQMAPSAIPPHLSLQNSLPPSPLPQSPLYSMPAPLVTTSYAAIQPITPMATLPPVMTFTTPQLTSPHIQYASSFVDPAIGAGYMNVVATPAPPTPMSKLAYLSVDGVQFAGFPDVASLEPLPPPQPTSELFSPALSEVWWGQPQEALHKQAESNSFDALSRMTVDRVFLSGRLARCRLALETSRAQTTSRRARIGDIRKLAQDISNMS